MQLSNYWEAIQVNACFEIMLKGLFFASPTIIPSVLPAGETHQLLVIRIFMQRFSLSPGHTLCNGKRRVLVV